RLLYIDVNALIDTNGYMGFIDDFNAEFMFAFRQALEGVAAFKLPQDAHFLVVNIHMDVVAIRTRYNLEDDLVLLHHIQRFSFLWGTDGNGGLRGMGNTAGQQEQARCNRGGQSNDRRTHHKASPVNCASHKNTLHLSA